MSGPYAQAATLYWSAGWPCVLPLPASRKCPPPEGYTGHAGVWPSRADVQAWSDGPEGDGNIALRVPPDVIGLDVDNYDGKCGSKTYADAAQRWGSLPFTWRSTNREDGQGSILFYRVPPGLAWPGEVGPAVEIIQYAHRYAVVWPSLHPDGRPYRWITPAGELATCPPRPDELPWLPQAWVDGLTAGAMQGDLPHAGYDHTKVEEWISERGTGQPCPDMLRCLADYGPARFRNGSSRHDAARNATRRITALAADGHRGMTAALGLVEQAFRASIEGDKDRPSDPHEWRRMINGAVQIAAAMPQVNGDPCMMPPPTPAEAFTEHVGLLANVHNGAWLDQQTFAPLHYAVQGIVPEGSGLLVGAPKVGKSFFVLDLALAKASGGPALGAVSVAAGPVLYLALEDSDRRVQSRCHGLLGLAPTPPAFEYITTIEPLRVLDTIAAWLKLHDGECPLVILDTLAKVMPPAASGESTYGRDYRIGSDLKRIIDAQPGAALLVNHHDRKAGAADFIDAVSGTHGLAGAADTILVLHRERNDIHGVLRVTGRDVPEERYAVIFDGEGWTLDGADLAAAAHRAEEKDAQRGLADRSRDVLDLVNKHPDGIGPTEVANAVGIDPRAAGVYLARLTGSGRITKVGRGDYRPLPSPTPVETVEGVETEGDDLPDSTHSTVSTPPLGDNDPERPRLTREQHEHHGRALREQHVDPSTERADGRAETTSDARPH